MNVEDEISLPGLVGAPDAAGTGPPSGGGPGISLAASIPAETELEIQSDDEELEDVEETVMERLAGLTEMLPDKVWKVLGRAGSVGSWFVRRSAWVIGTSMALLVFPPLIEQQRMEFEEMQNMQKKQMLLGPGQPMSQMPGPR